MHLTRSVYIRAVFWIENTDPYPQTNGGHTLGMLEVLSASSSVTYMLTLGSSLKLSNLTVTLSKLGEGGI